MHSSFKEAYYCTCLSSLLVFNSLEDALISELQDKLI